MLLIAILALISSVWGLNFGELCDPSPLYRDNWQYDDSCENIYLFCDASTRTCNYRGCTNSDYIKGWDLTVRPFPTRCGNNTYCPDSNSKCTDTVAIGSHCEIQRDDECMGQSSICLNSTCFVKGAPFGGNCGADTTSYVSYDAGGNTIHQVIIRDNCTTGTYCFQSNASCVMSKINSASCEQDRECLSGTCSNDGACVDGPDVFHQIHPWLWGVLATAIVIFVFIILGTLWILHRYQSKKEHEKIVSFFGANEEFAKYAMIEDSDSYSDEMRTHSPYNDSHTSLVYLTTPDYATSQALCTNRTKNTNRPSSGQK